MDEVIHSEPSVLGTYQYIRIGQEPMTDNNLPYLPHEQCPACGDIGQCCYKLDRYPIRWARYCPYCHVRYIIKLERSNNNA